MRLQDYIHYYIGCKIQKDSGMVDYPIVLGVVGDQVYLSEYRYTTPDSNGVFIRPELSHHVSFIKPALRTLESMTESEMIGLLQSMVPAEMEDKPKDDNYSIEMFYNDNGNMVDNDVIVGANYSCICFEGQIAITKCGTIRFYDEGGSDQQGVNMPKAYAYLLLNHFDLFGLINAGLAIEITIQPTTNEQS